MYALTTAPNLDVRCNLGGDSAIAVFRTPRGCVARPNDRFQALCLQHIETDGISEGSRPILDLSANEKWSEWVGDEMPLHLGYSVLQLQEFLATLGLGPDGKPLAA